MSEPTYDIFFKGEALEGFAPELVRANFCKLFKTTDEKAAGFFSGKVVALKRNIDKATAIKFQSTLKKAGLKIYIKAHAGAAATAKPQTETKPTTEAPPKAANQQTSAAPALAASAPAPTPQQAPPAEPTEISLAPTGANVLADSERSHVEAAPIDTSAISLASQFAPPETPVEAAPVSVDTSHLTAAAPGADILEGHHEVETAKAPDVSHIALDESGDPLNIDNIDIPLPEPDTQHISLAEPGADLDTKPKKAPPPAPSTDHIQLDS